MPLVTRTANASQVYSQATAPTITQDGEVWIDTDTGAVYSSENGAWVAQSGGAIGTARQALAVNSAATALEYVASLQSLMTAQGDVIYSTAANTPARLAKGTALHVLRMNAGATAPEWAAAGSTYELLDTHEASGAEASYTYTPGSTLTGDAYSKIVIIFTGEATAAFALQAVINGIAGTSYGGGGNARAADGSLTNLTYTGAAQMTVLTNAIPLGDVTCAAFLELYLDDSGINEIIGKSWGADSDIKSQSWHHTIAHTDDTITSIKLQTSTSTWKVSSKISIYGVKRT